MALEVAHHAARLARPVGEQLEGFGQVLGAEDDQGDHPDDQQFGPGDVEHGGLSRRAAPARSRPFAQVLTASSLRTGCSVELAFALMDGCCGAAVVSEDWPSSVLTPF